MRVLVSTLAAAFVAVAMAQPAQASDEIAEGLCTAISADDRQRLRTILSNHNVRIRNVFSSIRCNGQSMLQFAITAEADEVGEMLIRQLPVRAIEEDLIDGKSVLEWAEQAGYASSAVVGVVRERLAG